MSLKKFGEVVFVVVAQTIWLLLAGLFITDVVSGVAKADDTPRGAGWQVSVSIDPMTDRVTRSLSTVGEPLSGGGLASLMVSCDNDEPLFLAVVPGFNEDVVRAPLVRFGTSKAEPMDDGTKHNSTLLEGLEAAYFLAKMDKGDPMLVRFYSRLRFATYEFDLSNFAEHYFATCSTHPDYFLEFPEN